MNVRLLPVAVLALLLGCAERTEAPAPDREARVAVAEAAYDPAAFDTVAWTSERERTMVGDIAYAAHCRNCHGPMGRGETDYAREHGLEVPSLVEPGWPHDGDVAAVRRLVFTGHAAGMPALGLTGLSAREIDAIAYFVVDRLRPEAMHDAARGAGEQR